MTSSLRRFLVERRRPLIALSLALAVVSAALAFRLFIVSSWHAPAGDGLQYYALSQTLIHDHRFAFAANKPPQFSRLPGYPLFLAAIVHEAPLPMHTHLWIAAQANAILDILSALLVFLILRQRRIGLPAAWAAFAAVVVCPMLIFMSTYGLSESLATFLTTLVLFCALRDGRWWAVACGVACGLLQLVRIDGFAVMPALALAVYFGASAWRERLLRAAIIAVTAMVVFAPWPIRNYKQFGALHIEGTAWMRQDGQPLPLGMMHWMRSWATGAWGQDFPLLKVANDGYLKVDRGGIILPVMYDNEPERQIIINLFERYNRRGLTPDVDADFDRLANERRAHSYFHYYVTLPLHRFVAEWTPMPEWELPVRSQMLHLPAWRRGYNFFERVLFALALAGAVLLCRRDPRLVAIVVTAVAARAALHAAVHPFPVERYMVESFPMMMALTGVGVALGFAALRERWRERALRRRVPAAERA
jgi:4-amino-4-deoxy-L-arabinose transferase-like glycosyltransferase